MSINVTVNGNPIGISRGKMVTSETNHEFNRRRQIRLQQVRQQSKEIAADVRNRVRKEKEKQLSKAEQQSERELKRFQARKLHNLQKHYEDCNCELGAAHTCAISERDPAQVLNEIEKKNRKEARIRGKIASDRFNEEENQRVSQEEKPKEVRKETRKIENIRAAMIADISKKCESPSKKRKKVKNVSKEVTDFSDDYNSDIENIANVEPVNKKTNSAQKKKYFHNKKFQKNISPILTQVQMQPKHKSSSPQKQKISPRKNKKNYNIQNETQLDLVSISSMSISSEHEQLKDFNDDFKPYYDLDPNISYSPLPPDRSELPQATPKTSPKKVLPHRKHAASPKNKGKSAVSPKKHITTNAQKKSPEKIKEAVEIHHPVDKFQPVNFYQSKKIAERIRQRTHDQSENLDDIQCDYNKVLAAIKSSTNEPKNLQMENIQIVNIPGEKPETPIKKAPTKSPLPFVSKVVLKPDNFDTNLSENQSNKVKYYDHIHRYSTEYNPPPLVQKVDKDNISIHPFSESSERTEFFETLNKQNKIAQRRGNKAMEKARIHQEYKQLLEELPALQRQERLASMRSHKPEFHMSDRRLSELERRRQNQIENIFEKYYHKSKVLETPLVTIHPVQKQPPDDEMKLPFTALDLSEDTQQLYVGQWKSEDISNRNNYKQFEDQTYSQNVKHELPSKDNDDRIKSKQPTDDAELQYKQKCLAELLERLNKQRELLLQEVDSLPPASNLHTILQDDEMLKVFGESSTLQKPAVKKTVSTATSPITETTKLKTKSKTTDKKRETVTTSSDSSDDKKKKKPKPKVKKTKIIKNEGTQTSPLPKNDTSEKNIISKEKSENIDKKQVTTEENDLKLCEIIIKMTDESKVKICTQSTPSNLISNESDNTYKLHIKPTEKTEKPVVTKQKPQESKKSPIINDISSSTSYMSPPIMHSVPTTSTIDPNQQTSGLYYKDILYTKPKQTNIDKICECYPKMKDIIMTKKESESKIKKSSDKLGCDCTEATLPNNVCKCVSGENQSDQIPAKEVKSELTNYIVKLLGMSRKSIDELTVSSVSDISSPGPNIVDTAENNPLFQLKNVMNYYNVNLKDIQQQLILSETSNSSQNQTVQNKSIKNKSTASAVTKDENSQNNQQSSIADTDFDKTDYNNDADYNVMLQKYQKVAQNCVNKISTLTSMIDKIRSEKERILSPDSLDMNEISTTSYFELPSFKNQKLQQSLENHDNKTINRSKNSSSSDSHKSTLTQDEIDKYLLEIALPKRNEDEQTNNEKQSTESFVPMLQGIPKYSNQSTQIFVTNSVQYPNNKTRPPASLIQNVQRYNLNIDMTPHELSTIVELDTVASSRNLSDLLQRPNTSEDKVPSKDQNNDKDKTSISNSDFITITPENYVSPETENSIDRKKKKLIHGKKAIKKSSPKKSDSSAPPEELQMQSELQLSGILRLSPTSDCTSSSPENIETILRNMGLGWAVSTLKKTQEALALSSSSSSLENSIKKRINLKEGINSSASEVSLKEVLSREFIKKLSTSSLSNSSPEMSPHFPEIGDVSEIVGGTRTQNKDRSAQRTSTPVHQSKSTDSKNNLFASESDVSSVKNHSDENMFLSIPNVSLDTNRSLDKSNK